MNPNWKTPTQSEQNAGASFEFLFLFIYLLLLFNPNNKSWLTNPPNLYIQAFIFYWSVTNALSVTPEPQAPHNRISLIVFLHLSTQQQQPCRRERRSLPRHRHNFSQSHSSLILESFLLLLLGPSPSPPSPVHHIFIIIIIITTTVATLRILSPNYLYTSYLFISRVLSCTFHKMAGDCSIKFIF